MLIAEAASSIPMDRPVPRQAWPSIRGTEGEPTAYLSLTGGGAASPLNVSRSPQNDENITGTLARTLVQRNALIPSVPTGTAQRSPAGLLRRLFAYNAQQLEQETRINPINEALVINPGMIDVGCRGHERQGVRLE